MYQQKSYPHFFEDSMSKFLISIFCLFAFSFIEVHAESLNCDVSLNGEIASDMNLQINKSEQKNYLTIGTYYFYVKNLGGSLFELEIYNSDGPERSYAEGIIRDSTDKLSWTLWTRDILIETKCKLAEVL